MAKNTTLCFRTEKNLKDSLKKSADARGMTLSAFIEHVLYEYLDQQDQYDGTEQERRRFLRKQTSIPVAVKSTGGTDLRSYAGTIEDISLGGVGIAVPDTFKNKVRDAPAGTSLEIFFSLPGEDECIRIQCSLARLLMLNGQEIHLGAAFEDVTPETFNTLKGYLEE